MNCFRLALLDSTGIQQFDQVESFVGSDCSGSFSLWAHHQRFVTLLEFGLARYRCPQQEWTYIAMPGAVLHFEDNLLQLVSRRFLLDPDYQRISELLTEQLLAEEQVLHSTKLSLRRLEENLIRQLWQNSRPRQGGL